MFFTHGIPPSSTITSAMPLLLSWFLLLPWNWHNWQFHCHLHCYHYNHCHWWHFVSHHYWCSYQHECFCSHLCCRKHQCQHLLPSLLHSTIAANAIASSTAIITVAVTKISVNISSSVYIPATTISKFVTATSSSRNTTIIGSTDSTNTFADNTACKKCYWQTWVLW